MSKSSVFQRVVLQMFGVIKIKSWPDGENQENYLATPHLPGWPHMTTASTNIILNEPLLYPTHSSGQFKHSYRKGLIALSSLPPSLPRLDSRSLPSICHSGAWVTHPPFAWWWSQLTPLVLQKHIYLKAVISVTSGATNTDFRNLFLFFPSMDHVFQPFMITGTSPSNLFPELHAPSVSYCLARILTCACIQLDPFPPQVNYDSLHSPVHRSHFSCLVTFTWTWKAITPN